MNETIVIDTEGTTTTKLYHNISIFVNPLLVKSVKK